MSAVRRPLTQEEQPNTMAFLDILKFVAALALVLSLIGGCAWAASRLNLLANFNRRTGSARLAVRESLTLDAKHRLMIVASDKREHVLLFGPSGDLVIESRDTVVVNGVGANGVGEDPGCADGGREREQTIIPMVKDAL